MSHWYNGIQLKAKWRNSSHQGKPSKNIGDSITQMVDSCSIYQNYFAPNSEAYLSAYAQYSSVAVAFRKIPQNTVWFTDCRENIFTAVSTRAPKVCPRQPPVVSEGSTHGCYAHVTRNCKQIVRLSCILSTLRCAALDCFLINSPHLLRISKALITNPWSICRQ